MPSVHERKRKSGKPSGWLAQIRIAGAPEVNKTFEDRDEAVAFGHSKEEELRSQIRMRRLPDLRRFNQESLRDALLLYRANARSISKGNWHIITAIIGFIGSATMEQIDEQFAQGYADRALRTLNKSGRLYSRCTVANHFTLMSNAYKARAKHYRIPAKKSFFSRSCLPEGFDEGRDRRLSKQEERAIRKVMLTHHAKHWWRLLMRLALETGARQTELAQARWPEFDLDLGVWNLPRMRTKARKARLIPLSRRARRILECLSALRREGEPMVFAGLPAGVSGAFARMTKAAHVQGFRFHDLRHEAISRMVARKRQLSVYEIMKIVGHSTLKMLDRYHNMRPQDIVLRMG